MGSKSHLLGLERQAQRVMLDAAARLRPNSWSSLEIRIVNISRTGFRAECEARLLPGSCVSLDVPGIGSVEAQVEWQREAALGAKFLYPINLARCEWGPKCDLKVLAQLLVERARQSDPDAEHGLRPIVYAEGRRGAV